MSTLRIIAFVLWGMLVVFLAVMLWPTEVDSVRSVWTSTMPNLGSFGNQGGPTDPPFWFLATGVGLIAIVYTIPGLTFAFAKSRIDYMHEFWRGHKQTLKVLERGEELREYADKANAASHTATYFDNDHERTATSSALGLEGLQAYEGAIRAQINGAQTQLASGVALQPHERRELENTINTGRRLLATASTITV